MASTPIPPKSVELANVSPVREGLCLSTEFRGRSLPRSGKFAGTIVSPVRPNSDRLASGQGRHLFESPDWGSRDDLRVLPVSAWVAQVGSAEIGGAKQRKPRVCLCPDVVNLRKR